MQPDYLSLQVALGARSYHIHAGSGLLASAGSLFKANNVARDLVIVSNARVADIYLSPLMESLQRDGFRSLTCMIPDGEEYKNEETLFSIYDAALSADLDRGATFVALGGGVVGDITGFAAATYLRGVPFVQIPTTLLAQVDSSVGGKTGINHRLGKNLIGAFHQPQLVLADVATLLTLTDRDYVSGLAEVIKYGMTLDADFFTWLETNSTGIISREQPLLRHLVHVCCGIKAGVVAQDEREGGLRAVLNYGHTFGHAIEALAGYGHYTHGEAVAIGMVQATRLAEKRGFATVDDSERLINLLLKFNLPVKMPIFSLDTLATALRHDKKVKSGSLKFVLNKGIGSFAMLNVLEVQDIFTDLGLC